MGRIYTAYQDPVMLPPRTWYGKNIAIIGTSNGEKENFHSLTYTSTREEVEAEFGQGVLLSAFEELKLAGSKYIYMVRIQDNSLEEFNRGLSALSGFPIHIVLLADLYFDDGIDYAIPLADFCASQADCIGIMGVRPFAGEELERGEGESLLSWKERLNLLVSNRAQLLASDPRLDKFGDAGMYLNIVFSTMTCFSDTMPRYISGHTLYAGLLANLSPGISPVNKSLIGADRLLFDPTDILAKNQTITVEEQLSEAGFVTISKFVKTGIAPSSAATMSKTELKAIQNVRLLQDVSWFIRAISEDLLGEPFVKRDEILEAQIKEYLSAYVAASLLRSFDVYFSYEGQDVNVCLGLEFQDTVMLHDIIIRLPQFRR